MYNDNAFYKILMCIAYYEGIFCVKKCESNDECVHLTHFGPQKIAWNPYSTRNQISSYHI